MAALVVGAVLVVLLPAAAVATSPSAWGGRIVFDRCIGSNPCQIFTVDPDGTNLVQLTTGPDHYAAAWSPDGSQIAFTSYAAGNYDIWIMNADGSNPRQLTHSTAWDEYPTWSPNGTRIAFDSHRSGNWDIWAVNVDGTGLQQVTKSPATDAAPDWSPDGLHIAFSSDRSGNVDVWTLRSNGTSPQQLTTSGAFDGLPKYSPDGTRIAFTSSRTHNYDIWTIGATGGGATDITPAAGPQIEGSWAPNGHELVYSGTPSGSLLNLWATSTDPDETYQLKVTQLVGFDELPDWQAVHDLVDWPQQGFDAGHSSFNPTETRLSAANVGQLERAGNAYAGPTAVLASGVFAYSDINSVSASDPQTGLRLWRQIEAGADFGAPAVVGGIVFVSDQRQLHAFTLADGQEIWSTDTFSYVSAPVIDGSKVYVVIQDASGNVALDAFDQKGVANCSGSPVVCEPIWSAPDFAALPAVAGSVVYAVKTSGWPNATAVVGAFDAAGVTGCSGTPPICEPMWTASVALPFARNPSTITVGGGLAILADDAGQIWAFDAAGTRRCSGAPLKCRPLWTIAPFTDGANSLRPAIANGIVYVTHFDNLYAFDGAGKRMCSGTPNVCQPLWTANESSAQGLSPPTVANGVVFAGSYATTVYAFDAAGCGHPTCAAVWSDQPSTPYRIDQPLVANGVLYAPMEAYGVVFVYRLPMGGGSRSTLSGGPLEPQRGHVGGGAAISP